MSNSLTKAVLLAAILLSGAQAVRAQSACGSPTDDDVVSLRNSVGSLLSGSTSFDVAYRAGTGLPNVADSAVAIVQDTTVCRQAQTALLQAWGSGSTSEPVWVLRISSTHYLVYNNRQISYGRTYGVLLSSAFAYLRYVLV